MTTAPTPGAQSRQIFLGDHNLSVAFSLIGFETRPSADVKQLDALLDELLRSNQRAFVVIDHALAAAGSELLAGVYDEGGRILVTEIPPLNSPRDFRSQVDEEIGRLLGDGDLKGSAA